jgi:hypothetical protein
MPHTSSVASFSSAVDFVSLNFTSSPVSNKIKRRKSAFESIVEEISLKEFNGSLKQQQQHHTSIPVTASAVANMCTGCLAHNHDRTMQYLDDTYQCADCAELYLDVNNNFRKPSQFSLSSNINTSNRLTNNNSSNFYMDNMLASQQSSNHTSSKVTFASLFSDMSNFDQNGAEVCAPPPNTGIAVNSPDSAAKKLVVNASNSSKPVEVDENNNEIVSVKRTKFVEIELVRTPARKHGPIVSSSIDNQQHRKVALNSDSVHSNATTTPPPSPLEELYENRSISVDVDFTTDSELSEHIYENDDFVYI